MRNETYFLRYIHAASTSSAVVRTQSMESLIPVFLAMKSDFKPLSRPVPVLCRKSRICWQCGELSCRNLEDLIELALVVVAIYIAVRLRLA